MEVPRKVGVPFGETLKKLGYLRKGPPKVGVLFGGLSRDPEPFTGSNRQKQGFWGPLKAKSLFLTPPFFDPFSGMGSFWGSQKTRFWAYTHALLNVFEVQKGDFRKVEKTRFFDVLQSPLLENYKT